MKAVQRTSIAAVIAVGLLALPNAAMAQQQIDDTRVVSPTVRVEIEDIIVGHIRIIGGAGNEMTVTGTIGDDVDEFGIDGGPDSVEIYVDLGDWDDDDNDRGRRRWRRRDHNDIDVNLEIHLPAGASLEIEGVTATFEVEGVDGVIEIESVTGDITYSGNATRLDIENVTGSITASAGNVSEANLESVNGTISFTGGVVDGGEIDIENVNGSIELVVPGDISANFYVETMMGDIDNAFGQEPRRESRWLPSQELRFTTGTGSAEIQIETLQGSVQIRRR